jgi:two-component system, NtrC family, response regulator AtoC
MSGPSAGDGAAGGRAGEPGGLGGAPSEAAAGRPLPASGLAPTLELTKFPVLVVDDEPDNLDAFRFNFRRGFAILCAGGGEEGLEILKQRDVAVIVTDQRMPRMTGLEFLRAARAVRPGAVGIILTAFTDVDVLIKAINLGHVYRYITKPWDSEEVRGVLTQAIERYHLRCENHRLEEQLRQYAGYLSGEMHAEFDFGAIVGEASCLKEVLARVEQVAPTDSTVLLRGESGTGKELVAHAIHINSPREDKPFVRVNCAALAPGVLESELFGHEKGAFTGAISRRAGRFELADGGTLFLDEIGDLPMEVQVKLLRVLQEREFERVGGQEVIHVDVRLVSATHRDLESMVAEGKFREDLYYRLNVFPVHLPALRERLDDVPRLVEHFAAKFSRRTGKQVVRFDSAALQLLRSYTWPGNVRELENVVERAMIVARADVVTPQDLDFGRRPGSPQPQGAPAAAPASAMPLTARLHEEERREIMGAIERARGSIASAARALGINRSTLYYRLRKHDLEHLLPTKPGSGSDDEA